MTQNERLRALLAEARDTSGCHGVCVLECVRSRIDAALAEPGEAEETEHAMHMRIRAGYDKTIADSWRAKVAEVERERDEARANYAHDRAEWDKAAERMETLMRGLVKSRDEARAEAEALRADLNCPEDEFGHRCIRCDSEVGPRD